MEIGVVLILVIVTGTGIGFLGPYYFHGEGQANTLYVLWSLYSLCKETYSPTRYTGSLMTVLGLLFSGDFITLGRVNTWIVVLLVKDCIREIVKMSQVRTCDSTRMVGRIS